MRPEEDEMTRAVAINGSPRMEKGDTALVLTPFLQGMESGGCEVELFYADNMTVKPCDCGEMRCWERTPGRCVHKDDMEGLLASLKNADILVLATPVYVPLPGAMQNVINRLCPLLDPVLETREGRTRARFRADVQIKKIALVCTSGWWEKENCDTVLRIAEELAENASVEFAGAVLRPHASLLKREGELTEEGRAVLEAAERAGRELVETGTIGPATREEVSRPLISREALMSWLNQGP
jgi:multimeric flavodoxin WrbA